MPVSSTAVKEFSVFKFMLPDASRFRAFDAAENGLRVAGMMRHALKRACLAAGWDPARVDALVLGHAQETAEGADRSVGSGRFSILPLPCLEVGEMGQGHVAGPIRQVLITSISEAFFQEVVWCGRALSGVELIDEEDGRETAVLSLAPKGDSTVQHYVRPSSEWTSVTPVVLPGFDDPAHLRRKMEKGVSGEDGARMQLQLDRRIEGLLRKTIIQAGLPEELANHATLEWNRTGFLPGVQPVSSYGIPDHLKKYPRFHVRLRWKDGHGDPIRVSGPLCLGGGRFLGMGLFVGVH